jgi:hypothetical protein
MNRTFTIRQAFVVSFLVLIFDKSVFISSVPVSLKTRNAVPTIMHESWADCGEKMHFYPHFEIASSCSYSAVRAKFVHYLFVSMQVEALQT